MLCDQKQYQPRVTLSQPIRGQYPGHVINLSQWAAVSVTRHSLTVSSHIHRSRFQPISAVLLTLTPALTLTWFLISLKQIWTIWHTMPPTPGWMWNTPNIDNWDLHRRCYVIAILSWFFSCVFISKMNNHNFWHVPQLQVLLTAPQITHNAFENI